MGDRAVKRREATFVEKSPLSQEERGDNKSALDFKGSGETANRGWERAWGGDDWMQPARAGGGPAGTRASAHREILKAGEGGGVRSKSPGPPFHHTSRGIKRGEDPGSRAETYGSGCSITSSEAGTGRAPGKHLPGGGARGLHDAELRSL